MRGYETELMYTYIVYTDTSVNYSSSSILILAVREGAHRGMPGRVGDYAPLAILVNINCLITGLLSDYLCLHTQFFTYCLATFFSKFTITLHNRSVHSNF